MTRDSDYRWAIAAVMIVCLFVLAAVSWQQSRMSPRWAQTPEAREAAGPAVVPAEERAAAAGRESEPIRALPPTVVPSYAPPAPELGGAQTGPPMHAGEPVLPEAVGAPGGAGALAPHQVGTPIGGADTRRPGPLPRQSPP